MHAQLDAPPPLSAASSPSQKSHSPSPSSGHEPVRKPDAEEVARIFHRAQRIADENAKRHASQKRPVTVATSGLSGVRVVPQEEAAAFEERMRLAQLAERADASLRGCGVPTIYRGADVVNLDSVPDFARSHYQGAVDQVREVIERRPVIIALVGPRGPGKTTIGCGFVLESCRQGRSGRWLDVGDYFDFLKRTYGEHSRRAEGDVEGEWLRLDLLVIDKLESAANTEWEDRKLQRLIVKRYELARRTLLVSDDDPAALVQRLGESVIDRLRDGGRIVACNWQSLR